MNIIQAVNDPQLFKPLFRNLDTWKSWLIVIKAIFALPMDEAETALFTTLTGRTAPPEKQAEEAWLIVGRRGGKSRVAALIAIYLACFRDYTAILAPGERITIMVLACDRRQARVIFRYAVGLLEQVPMLSGMIERQDAESIRLSNRVDLEITTNSFRSVRGFTIGGVVCDETAYWRSEYSANPDTEVLDALRPALATVPNALIVGIGSPYRRSGVMYEAHKRHYGKEGSAVLVVQASSQQLNPTIPPGVIERAMEADPVAARAEWFAEFRSDVGSFLDSDLIERAIEPGRRERAPLHEMSYTAFADPSGGSHDSFTLAIGHRENERMVLDLCRGIKPPFSPEQVVMEFAALLKSYRCSSVVGDRYSGAWVIESFAKVGIHYRHSELTKSELYLESAPLSIELMQLERRTSRSGRDSVDHPPGGHDDHANAACGCLALLASQTAQEAHEIEMVGW